MKKMLAVLAVMAVTACGPGEMGPPGPAGPQGPAGPAGPSYARRATCGGSGTYDSTSVQFYLHRTEFTDGSMMFQCAVTFGFTDTPTWSEATFYKASTLASASEVPCNVQRLLPGTTLGFFEFKIGSKASTGTATYKEPGANRPISNLNCITIEG